MAVCPYCRHAMRSHYAGVATRAEDKGYRCHWVDGVPGGRCHCARPIPGWDIYGEPDRCFDALMNGKVFGKLIVYDDDQAEPRAEAYIDGGAHWNVYEPTRRQAADLLKMWRRSGFRIERDDA